MSNINIKKADGKCYVMVTMSNDLAVVTLSSISGYVQTMEITKDQWKLMMDVAHSVMAIRPEW